MTGKITMQILEKKRGTYRAVNMKGDILNMYWMAYYAVEGMKEQKADPHEITEMKRLRDELEEYAYPKNSPPNYGTQLTFNFDNNESNQNVREGSTNT